MNIKIHININDKRWDDYKIPVRKIVQATMILAGQNDPTEQVIRDSSNNTPAWIPRSITGTPFGEIEREISITLTNDKEIQKINKGYRGMDRPTNVLSFESGDSELLGDIFLSFDTIAREVGACGNTPDKNGRAGFHQPLQSHATHMIIHGVLHLLGYDHIKNKDAEKMEALEEKILFVLKEKERTSMKNQLKNLKSYILNKKYFNYYMAALLGAIGSLGFAPFYIWPATLVGIAGMYLLYFQVTGKRSEVKGNEKKYLLPLTSYLLPFVFGAAYSVANFWWVLHSIFVVPDLQAQFAIFTIPGVIGIALVGGLIFMWPFVITEFVIRKCVNRKSQDNVSRFTIHGSRPIIFAAAWAFVLWAREWIFTGFPWNPLANIMMPYPMLSNSMALWGALGLSFVLIGLAVSVAEVIRHKAYGIKDFMPIGIFTALLVVGAIYGAHNIRTANTNHEHESPVIRIVQPAAPQDVKMSRERAIELAYLMIELSKSDGLDDVDIVVWPETSFPFVINKLSTNFGPASTIGRTTVFGATTWRAGNFYNSLIVAAADGNMEHIFSKFRLVPFGEYRPFGDIIPTPGELTPGAGPEIIGIRDSGFDSRFYFVPAICYEIIFSDMLLPRTRTTSTSHELPQAIINITNDTWFGRTPGTFQHLDMTRRQAIEMGLPVVRSNYSGISAFINADGRIVSYLPIGYQGVLDGRIGTAHITPFRIIGLNGWMIIILIFSLSTVLIIKRLFK
ncbi:MAG: apolipoprotein N-acyltransferase [Alphaproteobacteria bacterium]|nr:apolipoprotein N-acyltransferase [Alphaproteobacteria bacterium]